MSGAEWNSRFTASIALGELCWEAWQSHRRKNPTLVVNRYVLQAWIGSWCGEHSRDGQEAGSRPPLSETMAEIEIRWLIDFMESSAGLRKSERPRLDVRRNGNGYTASVTTDAALIRRDPAGRHTDNLRLL